MSLASKSIVLGGVIAMAGLAACAPTVSQRGYFPDPTRSQAISVGVDTKTSIADRLGTPTLQSSFDSNTWYYVSETQLQVVWYEPWITKQDVIEVKFDEADVVADVKRLTEVDMHKVDPVARTTATKGRTLSFFEQMFGNVGRLPGASEQGPGSTGGGGGR